MPGFRCRPNLTSQRMQAKALPEDFIYRSEVTRFANCSFPTGLSSRGLGRTEHTGVVLEHSLQYSRLHVSSSPERPRKGSWPAG